MTRPDCFVCAIRFRRSAEEGERFACPRCGSSWVYETRGDFVAWLRWDDVKRRVLSHVTGPERGAAALVAIVVMFALGLLALGCGDVSVVGDAGPAIVDVAQDAGTDAVADAGEPETAPDASASDTQPGNQDDAQPSPVDGGNDAGDEVAPSCAPTGVCHTCRLHTLCAKRTDGAYACCDSTGTVLFCDVTICTQT